MTPRAAPAEHRGSASARCHSRDGLPDRHCTPGALAPAASARTVCAHAYSRRLRPPRRFTETLKPRLLAAYGYRQKPLSGFELDHLIPISIGGAPRALRNLWPERSGAASGYQAKDQIEVVLARAVCAREVPLDAAQTAIANDWRTALRQLGLPLIARSAGADEP